MKKDKILSNILFYLGIVLLAYTLFSLVYQIYLTTKIDWHALHGEELTDIRSYVIIDFVTVAVKFVISSYGIYCKKHVDETINPLFTFTIFFVIFVILEVISMFNTINGASFKEVMSQYKYVVATAIVDGIVALFYLVVTLMLKHDDWRSQKDE